MQEISNNVCYVADASLSGILCGNLEIADTFLKRLVGLLGRKSLQPGTGIWLHPSSGIHTFGMRFAIDAVALDADMKVVGLYPSIAPWRVAAISKSTHSVLELPSGHLATTSLALGETISVRRRTPADL